MGIIQFIAGLIAFAGAVLLIYYDEYGRDEYFVTSGLFFLAFCVLIK